MDDALYICIKNIKYSCKDKWNAYGPNEQFWRVFDRSRFWKLRKQNGRNEMRRVEDYRECRLRIRVRILSKINSKLGKEIWALL